MNENPHILVAYKKSRYEHYIVDEQDETVQRLIEGDHISVRSLVRSHRIHQESLNRICEHLGSLHLRFDSVYRGDITSTEGYDLIITVGGDGTVLDLSHQVAEVPILAINSDPDESVGFFAAGTADEFPLLLQKTLCEAWEPLTLQRFVISINDEPCRFPVLNDILISHANPAAVSHYLLQLGQHPLEEQKSSGIWISTAAGSTAAIRSAGGYVLPFTSTDLQFLVREPYPPKTGGYRFLKGIHPIDEGFCVTSRMSGGRVFLDGPHISYAFNIGDTVAIYAAPHPLLMYGLEEQRRTG